VRASPKLPRLPVVLLALALSVAACSDSSDDDSGSDATASSAESGSPTAGSGDSSTTNKDGSTGTSEGDASTRAAPVIVSVTGRTGGGNKPALDSADIGKIEQEIAADSNLAPLVIAISNQYELGGSVETADGKSVNVIGVDASFGPAIWTGDLAPQTGYVVAADSDRAVLDVAALSSATSAAASTSSRSKFPVDVVGGVLAPVAQSMSGGAPSEVMFVETSTFESMAEAVLSTDWGTIQNDWNDGTLDTIPLISAVDVAVSGDGAADQVAAKLTELGYDATAK